jgi:hypothetical protein
LATEKSLVLIPHPIEVWKTQKTTAARNDSASELIRKLKSVGIIA